MEEMGQWAFRGAASAFFICWTSFFCRWWGVAPDTQKGMGGGAVAPHNDGPFLVALLGEAKEPERLAQRHTLFEVLNGGDDSSLQGGVILGLPDHREDILTKQDPGPRQTPKDPALVLSGFLKCQVVCAVLKENAVLLANVGVIVDAAPGGDGGVRDFLSELPGQQVLLTDQVEHDHRSVILFLFHDKIVLKEGAKKRCHVGRPLTQEREGIEDWEEYESLLVYEFTSWRSYSSRVKAGSIL